jgi:hypothetical protein
MAEIIQILIVAAFYVAAKIVAWFTHYKLAALLIGGASS